MSHQQNHSAPGGVLQDVLLTESPSGVMAGEGGEQVRDDLKAEKHRRGFGNPSDVGLTSGQRHQGLPKRQAGPWR